jgi:PucR C-terminal helix-turn-helix domain
MPSNAQSSSVRSAADLELGAAVTSALRDLLPAVAEQTVAAVIAQVPAYAGALSGEMRGSISRAVEMALLGFLKLASQPWQSDPGTPLGPALDAAYALGRGEARSGRSVDALLAAYRVGARVAWRAMAEAAVTAGMAVTTMARFADLVFAYIDELSAASVAGHTDELSTSGRVRERYLEQLAQQLLAGAPTDVLVASAGRADWSVPHTLTAVLLPDTQVHGLTSLLPSETLRPREELPDLEYSHETALLLVPDVAGADREQLLRALAGRQAVIGPARPWTQVRVSYLRAVRMLRLEVEAEDGAVDTERYLADLVLGADPDALADLRAQVLAPLSGMRPGTAERLAQTLRSWLLHQGRRDDVAAELFVHAQTVRYRMGQIRELYGDALQDPNTVLKLTIALGITDEPGSRPPTAAGAFRVDG